MDHKHYIKFRIDLIQKELQIDPHIMDSFNGIRSELKKRKWLGALPDGTGFGNISFRSKGNEFWITASGTGHLETLSPDDIALVKKADIAGNFIRCSGSKAASSESLSHAACYLNNDSVSVVIHIHDAPLWKKSQALFPVTDPGAEYGTPALAYAIAEMVGKNNGPSGLIVMGGHPDGLLVYGQNAEAAMWRLDKLKKQG